MVVVYEEGMQNIKSFKSRGQTSVSGMERKQPNNLNFIKSHGSYQMRHWFVYEKRDAMDCVRNESRDVWVICSTAFGCTVMRDQEGCEIAAVIGSGISGKFAGRNGNLAARRWPYIGLVVA